MDNMHTSLEKFAALLRQVKKTLDGKKQDVSQAGDKIFAILDTVSADFALGGEISSGFEQQIRDIFADFAKGIDDWKRKRREALALEETVKGFGDGLVVMAFGRTNAGKSTVGNFLRGKQLRSEGVFKNSWQDEDFAPSPIQIIEKGSDFSTEAGEEWLKEGSSETTREIQCFTLPGFLWVDTPGFGSLNDSTLGELARKYVEAADLIIYLEDSDNPGLQAQTQNLVQELQRGRDKILIAINKSDRLVVVKGADGKCIKDENGKLLRQRVGKSPDNRRLQEDYLTGILKERINKDISVKAISISTLLAKEAVKKNDDRMFADSNMAEFFRRINDIVPDNNAVLEIKYNKAISDCIHIIDSILGIGGNEEDESLKILEDRLVQMEEDIMRKCENIDIGQITAEITGSIMFQVRPRVNELINDAAEAQRRGAIVIIGAESFVDGVVINPDVLINKVREDASKMIDTKAREIFSALFFENALSIGKDFPTIAAVQLKSRQERHTYTVPGIKYERRASSGFIETIKEFLGKKFYRAVRTEETREQIIDLGLNVREVVAELNENIENNLAMYISSSLKDIRKECLDNGQKYLNHARQLLHKAQEDLQRYKNELAQMSKACS